MPEIHLCLDIDCLPEVAFDLSRCIDLHEDSTSQTNEKAVAGRTSGLIELGEEVTWEATHFGVRQRLTSRITAFERPWYFRDSMVTGTFEWFDHDHHFELQGSSTRMTDRIDYTSPFGLLCRWMNGAHKSDQSNSEHEKSKTPANRWNEAAKDDHC